MDKTKYLLPREYEMLAILVPDQGEEESKAAIDKMISYITDEKGTIDSVSAESPWGRRRLAYTIRHEGVDYRDGHYALVYFTAMPNVLAEVERELKLDVNVIRYLILTHDPHMGEKIDESALQDGEAAEGEGTTDAPADNAKTDAPAATTKTEETSEAPAVEVKADETSEASAEDVKTEETTEAPAEEAKTEETVEAPAEEAKTEETVEAPAEEAKAEKTVEAPAEEAKAEPAPAKKKSSKLPEDGEGTEWISGDGTDNMPDGFPLKANASSKIYHPEESPSYNNIIAEIYFAQGAVAESHGYRLPKTLEKAAAEAGNAASDAADALKGGDEESDKE